MPLQSWLGDAMAGPTPVSALIHAATMVTAGVYLIARSSAIFDASPGARVAVTMVGTVTLLFGAIIGCAKDDIKKALAGSTMSQIGYMVLAAGLGPAGYAFAIAHLLAHGFFKADLFLGAGSVMHGMDDETDMRRFGGLRKAMPVTFWTFVLRLARDHRRPAVLPGFWTKDKIIETAFDKGGTKGWSSALLAILGAGITAFYMSRLVVHDVLRRAALGRGQAPARVAGSDDGTGQHPRARVRRRSARSSSSTTGSSNWLAPVVGEHAGGSPPVSAQVVSIITLVVVAVGAALAWQIYGVQAGAGHALRWAARSPARPARTCYRTPSTRPSFMRPGQYLTRILVFFDNRVVDGAVNGFAALIGGHVRPAAPHQTGFVRSYALSMFAGAVLVVAPSCW